MADNEVTIRFSADGIRRTLRRMESVREQMEDIGLTTERVHRAFRGLRTAVVGAGVGAAAVGTGMAVLAAKAAEAGSALEQARIKLDSLFGSAEEGARALTELREIAARLPFTFEEINQVAPTLAVISDDADQLRTRLAQAAELSARFGMSLQETTGNMVRFFTAGASAADLFRERGVLQALGVVAGEETTLEESKALWRQFFSDIEQSGSSALGRLANSFEGRLSMVQDAWFSLLTSIADSGVMGAVKESLTAIRQEMERFMDSGAARDFAIVFTDSLALMVGGIQGLMNALFEFQSFVRDTPAIRRLFGMAGIDMPRTARGELGHVSQARERIEGLLEELRGGAALGSVVPRAVQAGVPQEALQQAREGSMPRLMVESVLMNSVDTLTRAIDGPGGLAEQFNRGSNLMQRFNEFTDRLQAVLRGEAGATQPSLQTPDLTGFSVTGTGRAHASLVDTLADAGEVAREANDRLRGLVQVTGDGFSTIADVAITSMGQAVQAAITGFDNIASIILNSVNQILQSLSRQGVFGQGGFLSPGGLGVPLIGALGGILGAIVGGGSERPQKVDIASVSSSDTLNVEEQQDRGPETVILRVVSSTTGEVMDEIQYQLGRRERRDATRRIPSGVNLALGGI